MWSAFCFLLVHRINRQASPAWAVFAFFGPHSLHVRSGPWGRTTHFELMRLEQPPSKTGLGITQHLPHSLPETAGIRRTLANCRPSSHREHRHRLRLGVFLRNRPRSSCHVQAGQIAWRSAFRCRAIFLSICARLILHHSLHKPARGGVVGITKPFRSHRDITSRSDNPVDPTLPSAASRDISETMHTGNLRSSPS